MASKAFQRLDAIGLVATEHLDARNAFLAGATVIMVLGKYSPGTAEALWDEIVQGDPGLAAQFAGYAVQILEAREQDINV